MNLTCILSASVSHSQALSTSLPWVFLVIIILHMLWVISTRYALASGGADNGIDAYMIGTWHACVDVISPHVPVCAWEAVFDNMGNRYVRRDAWL